MLIYLIYLFLIDLFNFKNLNYYHLLNQSKYYNFIKTMLNQINHNYIIVLISYMSNK